MLDWARFCVQWLATDSPTLETSVASRKAGKHGSHDVAVSDNPQPTYSRPTALGRGRPGAGATANGGKADTAKSTARMSNISRAETFVVDKENMSPPSPDAKLQPDRLRMPPPLSKPPPAGSPSSPRAFLAPPSTFNGSVLARTMPSTNGRAMLSGIEDHEAAERARRYQEAFKIPSDSGVWYQSEAGLYYHLGLRSFEPLLPASWMVDFKTFPIALFEMDLEADCLIRNIHGPQFHAIRSLRELIETGNRVRDLTRAKHKPSRIQQSIQRSLEEYLQWALHDGDLYETTKSIPAHTIVQRRRGQSTIDALAQLAGEMVTQLQRHSFFYNKSHDYTPNPPAKDDKEQEAEIHDDSPGSNPPVIIGFLIVQTTVSIFTLNALNNEDAEAEGDEGRGIHMLGRFNFYETGHDVWNALAVAICCCHLRNSLLATAVVAEELREAMGFNGGDASIDHGTIAGYVSRAEYEAQKKRKYEEENENEGEAAQQSSNHTRKRVKRTPGLAKGNSDPDL